MESYLQITRNHQSPILKSQCLYVIVYLSLSTFHTTFTILSTNNWCCSFTMYFCTDILVIDVFVILFLIFFLIIYLVLDTGTVSHACGTCKAGYIGNAFNLSSLCFAPSANYSCGGACPPCPLVGALWTISTVITVAN